MASRVKSTSTGREGGPDADLLRMYLNEIGQHELEGIARERAEVDGLAPQRHEHVRDLFAREVGRLADDDGRTELGDDSLQMHRGDFPGFAFRYRFGVHLSALGERRAPLFSR